MRKDFGSDDDVIRQLTEHKQVLAVAGARFFAARVDGVLASYCDLYSDGQTAQIEAVQTLERFRNKGLARAVVSGSARRRRGRGSRPDLSAGG